jgi:hypothetical protein
VGPLRQLRPDLPETEIRLRVRTLFGAVHGVVHLALQGRLVGVPEPQLRQEVAALVGALVIGAKMARSGPG